MSRSWKQSLLTVPGLGIALLPKLACPLCWPAYAGLLSSVGLGFLISTTYLLPVTTAFLIALLIALAFRAKQRHDYGPLGLGTVGQSSQGRWRSCNATPANLSSCEELSPEDHRARGQTPDKSNPGRAAPGRDSPCVRAAPPFAFCRQARQMPSHTGIRRDCADKAPAHRPSVFRHLRGALPSRKHTPEIPSRSLSAPAAESHR